MIYYYFPPCRIGRISASTPQNRLLPYTEPEPYWDHWREWSTARQNVTKFTLFSAVCYLYAEYMTDLFKYAIEFGNIYIAAGLHSVFFLRKQNGVDMTFGMIHASAGGATIEDLSSKEMMQNCYREDQMEALETHNKFKHWNAMIYPFIRHTMKGIIMYLGEMIVSLQIIEHNFNHTTFLSCNSPSVHFTE